ncbi:MAG: hypothetical protein GJ680_06855 [Alteromonadaceae bacterium]|nr:hypothetical protein [Alteromonadaceae bacterium]
MNDDNNELNAELDALRQQIESEETSEEQAFFHSVERKQAEAFEQAIGALRLSDAKEKILEDNEQDLLRLRQQAEAIDSAVEGHFFMSVAEKQRSLENEALAALKSVSDEEQYRELKASVEAKDTPIQSAFFASTSKKEHVQEFEYRKRNLLYTVLEVFKWRPAQYALASFAVIALSFSMLQPQNSVDDIGCFEESCFAETVDEDSEPNLVTSSYTPNSYSDEGESSNLSLQNQKTTRERRAKTPPTSVAEELWTFEELAEVSSVDIPTASEPSRSPASNSSENRKATDNHTSVIEPGVQEDTLIARRSVLSSRLVSAEQLTFSDSFSSSASFDVKAALQSGGAAKMLNNVVTTAITSAFGTLAKISKVRNNDVIHTAICIGSRTSQLDSCGDIENWNAGDLMTLLVGTSLGESEIRTGLSKVNDIQFVDSLLDASRFAQFEMVPDVAFLSVFNTSADELARLNWCITIKVPLPNSACFQISSPEVMLKYYQYLPDRMILNAYSDRSGQEMVDTFLLNPIMSSLDFYPMIANTARNLTRDGTLTDPFVISMWLAYHLSNVNPVAFQQYIMMRLQSAQLPEFQKQCVMRLVNNNRLYLAPKDAEREVDGCF